MEANVKVSLIVPVYHVEKYLDRCIQSIQNQTYQNLEIILVDDGSPDKCPWICDKYAQEDARIKVIHKENGGLSDARNAGIECATGEYLIFIDSDDWIHKQYVEILVNVAVNYQVKIAICNFQDAYESRSYEDAEYQPDMEKVQIFTAKQALNAYFDTLELRTSFTVSWNKIYARELFSEIRFPKGKLHEDEFTTFKLIHMAEKVCYIDLPLYYYLSRTDSIMGKFKASRFDIFDGYIEKIKCFSEWNEKNLAVKTFFHAIHMLAQFVQWTKEAHFEGDALINSTKKKLSAIEKKYKLRKDFSRLQIMDYMLFSASINLYYTVWINRRKK